MLPNVLAMTDKKSKNLQTALILASMAAVFFIGIFVKQIWFR
ncbi:cytochrome oxidase small assembly protein [Sapientia aquatica]|nr:cytochrome oxidase small assembly protein [Sapientia aquatica]